jgi:hypothetical protein
MLTKVHWIIIASVSIAVLGIAWYVLKKLQYIEGKIQHSSTSNSNNSSTQNQQTQSQPNPQIHSQHEQVRHQPQQEQFVLSVPTPVTEQPSVRYTPNPRIITQKSFAIPIVQKQVMRPMPVRPPSRKVIPQSTIVEETESEEEEELLPEETVNDMSVIVDIDFESKEDDA